jgi:hypothetical protein
VIVALSKNKPITGASASKMSETIKPPRTVATTAVAAASLTRSRR